MCLTSQCCKNTLCPIFNVILEMNVGFLNCWKKNCASLPWLNYWRDTHSLILQPNVFSTHFRGTLTQCTSCELSNFYLAKRTGFPNVMTSHGQVKIGTNIHEIVSLLNLTISLLNHSELNAIKLVKLMSSFIDHS